MEATQKCTITTLDARKLLPIANCDFVARIDCVLSSPLVTIDFCALRRRQIADFNNNALDVADQLLPFARPTRVSGDHKFTVVSSLEFSIVLELVEDAASDLERPCLHIGAPGLHLSARCITCLVHRAHFNRCRDGAEQRNLRMATLNSSCRNSADCHFAGPLRHYHGKQIKVCGADSRERMRESQCE